MPFRSMRRRKRAFRPRGNTVIHVPSTMGGTLSANIAQVIIITSPSINAGGSATTNIEAQDKDRTVNVGHHIGRFNIDINIRNTIGGGVFEFCVFKGERLATTPILGTHPVPSTANILAQGMQQATRLHNPGKTFHFSKRVYTIEQAIAHKIIVSPAKYKTSKCKAGDFWVLMIFNRGGTEVTFDYECRFKEYE